MGNPEIETDDVEWAPLVELHAARETREEVQAPAVSPRPSSPSSRGLDASLFPIPDISINFADPRRVDYDDPPLNPPDRSRGRRRAASDPYNNPPSATRDSDRGSSATNLGRQSTSSLPKDREYILGLRLAPDTFGGDAEVGNSKRAQKHPAIFQCTLCPKRFTRAYNLRSHLRTHTDERPFVCTVCGKAFARQHDRKRHEGLHSGEKRFVCKGDLKKGGQWGCGRRFARVDALCRHFRSEAGQICIKPLLDEEIQERQRQIMSGDLSEDASKALSPESAVTWLRSTIKLPQALLTQYPALAGLDWGNLPQDGDQLEHYVGHDSRASHNLFYKADDERSEDASGEVPSVASIDTFYDSALGTSKVSARSSQTSGSGISNIAKDELLLILGGSAALNILYEDAVRRMSKERFVRNVRRLLLSFSRDLEHEVADKRSRDVVNMLRQDGSWLAGRLYDAANPNHAIVNRDMAFILTRNVDKRVTLDKYFQSTDPRETTGSESFDDDGEEYFSDPDQDDAESNISDILDEMEIDIDYSQFPNLDAIRNFLLDGQAFVDFEMRLAQFVYPERQISDPASEAALRTFGDPTDHLEVPGPPAEKLLIPRLDPSISGLDINRSGTSDEALTWAAISASAEPPTDISNHDSSASSHSTGNTSITAQERDTDDFNDIGDVLNGDSDSDFDSAIYETDSEERFRDPVGYFAGLREIEAEVYRKSSLLKSVQQSSPRVVDVFDTPLSPWSTRMSNVFSSISAAFWKALKNHARATDFSKGDLDILLQSRDLLVEACDSLRLLQEAKTCGDKFSFLVEDFGRHSVAILRDISISIVFELKDMTENLLQGLSESGIWSLNHEIGLKRALLTFWDAWESICSLYEGLDSEIHNFIATFQIDSFERALLLSRILNLAVISYVGVHIEPFDQKTLGCEVAFRIPCGKSNVTLSRRKLQCLDNFLHGKEVWVFHCGEFARSSRMLLLTRIDALADIWGPVWSAKNTPNEEYIKYYSVGAGYLLPWVPPFQDAKDLWPGGYEYSSETFCHWVSGKDFDPENATSDQPDDKLRFNWENPLLIGASGFYVNPKCIPSTDDLIRIKSKFQEQHTLQPSDVRPPRRYKDSDAIALQASVFQLITVGGSRTYKRHEGLTMKDALLEKWRNNTRSPSDLYNYGGIAVSLCTRNAIRTRILDLLRSRTLKNYLDSICFDWVSSECKSAYFKSLESRRSFQDFWNLRQDWRKCAGDAIYACLKKLENTGVDMVDRELRALWVESFDLEESDDDDYGGRASSNGSRRHLLQTEDSTVILVRSEYTWTGLVKDSQECMTMAVMVSSCFDYDDDHGYGRRCGRLSGRAPPGYSVLQTKLHLNKAALNNEGLSCKRSRENSKLRWSIEKLKKDTKFYLGEHGTLTVFQTPTDPYVVVEWEPLISNHVKEAEDVMKNQMFLGRAVKEHHQEYIGGVTRSLPLKILVLSNRDRTR